ncbi:MAG: phosphatase PAP2 family protein [Candidatus Wallbacteria bacterium]|nr:phosphatase PAP2 family protein [Candidatus Wallbacteria bacterium]
MRGRPLSWPTGSRILSGAAGALLLTPVFFSCYLGSAAFAGSSAHRWHLYCDWELSAPFWPAMIVPYLSMFALFCLPVFQLEPAQLRQLTKRLLVGSLAGLLVMLLLPAELGFPDRSDAGIWQSLYDGIYRIDNRFNTVPSFHVIYTATILLLFIEVATPAMRLAYSAWLVLVCASTVLTHRHHLLDVVAGLAIALTLHSLFRGRQSAGSHD